MNITLLTVGKTDVPWVRDSLALYAARLSHYTHFAISEIPQLKNVSALSREQIKEKEAALLLGKLRPTDEVWLLDERGKQYGSVEFASFLEGRMSRGRGDLVFVVGGAYGFAQEVYDRAAGCISLSKMTFSHQMVRTIFAEQLYRAFTIIRGEPYHNA